MPSTTPLHVAVVGAGSFGRNHLRVYWDLEQSGAPIHLAAIIDSNPAAAASAPGVPWFASVPDCRAAGVRIDAASVCVPTLHHVAVAEQLLHAGVDILIEKPIAATLEGADRILNLACQSERIVQVGHLERFNPAVTAARKHLTQPMFFEAHRLSIFTPRSLDIDVVLDLMVHDLDIVLSLVSSPVRELRAVGLPVLTSKADIANVRLEFENGCVANFTASRVSTERVRKLRFFQPHQYLSLDFARQDLFLIDAPDLSKIDPAQLAVLLQTMQHQAKNQPMHQPNQEKDQQHPSPGLGLRKVEVIPGEPLRLEIESFLHCVKTRQQPVVSAADGRAALALALDINRAIADHARRAGLYPG